MISQATLFHIPHPCVAGAMVALRSTVTGARTNQMKAMDLSSVLPWTPLTVSNSAAELYPETDIFMWGTLNNYCFIMVVLVQGCMGTVENEE